MASSKRLASGLRRARPPLASPRVAGRPRGTNRVTAWTRTKRLVHGSSFGAPAAAYAEHRPGYAQAAVRWALDPAPGPLVLDLGAGTGKLSATLVALGAEVIAVRPDSEMLTELRRALPTVRALAGSAEAVPLPDASVDAVRAGHALRWFDIDVAGPEIARVLVPGGIPAGLWNVIENRVDWTAGLERVSGSAAIGRVTAQQLARRDGRRGPSKRWPVRPVRLAGAGRVPARAVPHRRLATIATRAGLLVMPDQEQAATLGRIRAFLASRSETARGEFTLAC